MSEREMKTDLAVRAFRLASGALLLGMACAVAVSQWAGSNPDVVYTREPVFSLRVSTLWWIACGACAGAGLVCLFGQRGKLALGLVAWLAVNFEVYQAGLLWNGSPNLHGYLGEVSSAFGLSLGLLNAGINVVWGGLLLGSLALLLWRRAGVKTALNESKTAT
jgi:hypothetical protein